jgi:beta-phosphoglucomutase-like phosphatase (HAD superfamily)
MSDDVLVLWDIDGTLLNSGGVGRDLYEEVFLQLFGRSLAACAPMAGRTDRAIILETLTLAGVDQPRRHVDPFIAGLGARAQAVHEAVAARGHALAGAAQVLAALASARSLGSFAALGAAFPGVFDKGAGTGVSTALAQSAVALAGVAHTAVTPAAAAHVAAAQVTVAQVAVAQAPATAVPSMAAPSMAGAPSAAGGPTAVAVQAGSVQTAVAAQAAS